MYFDINSFVEGLVEKLDYELALLDEFVEIEQRRLDLLMEELEIEELREEF